MEYVATRNEPRVGIGDFTMDFRRGETYTAGDGPDEVPAYICDYLVSHGLLVDARAAVGRMEQPVPPSSPTPPKVVPLQRVDSDG